MKRVWAAVLVFASMLFSGVLFAQGKAEVIISGRKAGVVPALEVNGVMYVDVRAAARKFGAAVELFAQSKQAKITAKGFYGILTASLPDIIINARAQTLSSPVLVHGGKIMAPTEFFLLSSFQKAVGKRILFQDGAFLVERPFDFARTENRLNKQDTLLVFETEKEIAFSAKQINAHTVEVSFPSATVKRDEFFRLKTPFIASAEIRQSRENAVLKVILGKDAKDWSFTKIDGRLVFRAGAKAAPAVLEEPKPVLSPEPKEASRMQTQDVNPDPNRESPVSQTPSVLTEDDGFVEMFPEQGPVIKEAPAQDSKPAAPVKTSPVIKQEPHPLAVSPAHKKMRIVVDPGHGGKDPGAVRSRLREKDWNLAVGKELSILLKKAGFEVKMTRDDDTFIPLSDRSKISNNFKADLFISVHTNASKNKNAHGFQVYFRSEKATDKEAADVAAMENEAMQYEEVHYNFVDALLQSLAKNEFVNESSKLAGYVRNAVYKQPGIGIAVNQNSSVRQANFYVLKGVNSPAVLVEMGYISSPKDRARLSQKAVQKKMAQGIFNGVRDYAKKEGWIN